MAKRDYRTDEIIVHWDSSRCIHTGICLQSLNSVFNLRQKPWVDVQAARADEIAATVEKCPSGALTYTRLDGAGEAPPQTTTVV
ncbi:MAG: (4Fe-4S)-binding protein, partial [Acidimicrobiia bacterium]|nr:(4Fe-4S)-binding protein [Acidimicrobiia bacterium]